MSEHSLEIALKYGETLKNFNGISEAEKYFISYKDNLLTVLKDISAQCLEFVPDYTVESLKKLEKWYFDLYRNNSFDKLELFQNDFESIMSVYWGEVVIKNNEEAKWVIEEFPFSQNKYELFVNKGFCNVAIGDTFRDLYKKQGNTRKDFLFREYNKLFAK